MDASIFPNQTLAIFDGSSKKCVVGRCHDERQYLSYYSIRAIFFQLPGVISLIIHSRVENQSSDQLEVVHGGQFLSSPTTHTASPFSASILALRMLVTPHHPLSMIFYASDCRT